MLHKRVVTCLLWKILLWQLCYYCFCSHVQSLVEIESVLVATSLYFEHTAPLTYSLWSKPFKKTITKITRYGGSKSTYSIKFFIWQPINVLNNYFSVGIDAHIALNFHRARNSNPNHFTSRTRNLLYYGLEGGKDLFKQQWRNLMDFVTIECDGEDYTERLRAYGT